KLTDDVGVTQASYRAETGQPQDAAVRSVQPASAERTETFGFVVPAAAAPGASILVRASGRDTRNQTVEAAPVAITVLDAVAPAAQLVLPVADRVPPTGTLQTESGGLDIVRGRSFTVVAHAQDELGVAQVELTGTGAFTFGPEAKQVSPPTTDGQASFTLTV